MSLKKWICIVSNFIDCFKFHLICQMLAKFSGVESERTVSMFRKEKKHFRVLFTYSIKRAREIGEIHVAIVQQWLRNVQKSVIHVQICCFANSKPILFCHFFCCRRRSCWSSLLLWSRNFATIVAWRFTFPLYRWYVFKGERGLSGFANTPNLAYFTPKLFRWLHWGYGGSHFDSRNFR